MPHNVRAFVAVVPPLDVRSGLSRILDVMPPDLDIRPVPVEKVHLTMRFLGDVSPDQIDRIAAGLDSIGLSSTSFAAGVTEVAGFPSRRPVVVAATVASNSDLSGLADRLELLARSSGLEPDNRRFMPHITIARFRRPQRRKDIGPIGVEMRFTVGEIVLYRSDLQPGGSRYTPLYTAKLQS